MLSLDGLTIQYDFVLSDGRSLSFTVDPLNPARVEGDDAPPWVALGNHQCPNCPLRLEDHPTCPTAAAAAALIEGFSDVISYDEVEVVVRTGKRETRQRCDAQTGLTSLLGLVMATSGCPILAELKPMAVFHHPFSTPLETVYRTVGNYLIRQYFQRKQGIEADLSLGGLRGLYRELQVLNRAFVDRVRLAADEDANLNAVVLLFSISNLVERTLDDGLARLAPLYAEGGSLEDGWDIASEPDHPPVTEDD